METARALEKNVAVDFFSLAVLKRFAELVNHASHAHGRGYRVEDTAILASVGNGINHNYEQNFGQPFCIDIAADPSE